MPDGRGDRQKLRREEMIQAIAYIVQTFAVPVTCHVEGGYGSGSAYTGATRENENTLPQVHFDRA